MNYIKQEPFPHEDGAPASWQDNQDIKAAQESKKQSEQTVNQFMKMLLSTIS